MGDMADALIDGEFDYETGEYIGKGVGYPRTKNKMRRKTNVKAGSNYQSNKSKVWRLLFKDGNKGNLSETILFLICEEYAHAEIKLPKEVKESTVYRHILKDTDKFSKWYEITHPHYYKYLKD